MYKISYTGDGENTEYAFSFPFFQNADIKVCIDNNILDNTEYDVNPNADFNGVLAALKDAFGNKIAAGNSEGKIFIFEQNERYIVVSYLRPNLHEQLC